MNTSAVRFGNIGVIYGPKAKAEELIQDLGRQAGGIYYAENWSPQAKSGDKPVFAYATHDHLKALGGAQPSYDRLYDQYASEFKPWNSGSGSLGIGHQFVVSEARSGGLAHLHRLSFTA